MKLGCSRVACQINMSPALPLPPPPSRFFLHPLCTGLRYQAPAVSSRARVSPVRLSCLFSPPFFPDLPHPPFDSSPQPVPPFHALTLPTFSTLRVFRLQRGAEVQPDRLGTHATHGHRRNPGSPNRSRESFYLSERAPDSFRRRAHSPPLPRSTLPRFRKINALVLARCTCIDSKWILFYSVDTYLRDTRKKIRNLFHAEDSCEKQNGTFSRHGQFGELIGGERTCRDIDVAKPRGESARLGRRAEAKVARPLPD